ncbi:MAG: copper oxidase [Rhodocyclaceae bacterium]|nr:MAG: copper oxidase [Rhodocyclaceae bacterium]
MQRRDFLQLSGVGLLWQLAGRSEAYAGGSVPALGVNALPIPSLLTGSSFHLSLQTGQMEFLPGETTPTYGINGNYLGPAIKGRDGDNVSFTVTNNLTEPTALHWHGMHVPANIDGGPHQLIQPGATWNATFTVRQRAGTNWFHPHTHRQTGRQVYMGLAGLLMVEDAHTDFLDLPKTWGEDDIPLVIQDRRFRVDGSLAYLSSMMDSFQGMLGDVFLVNGAVTPRVSLPAKELRFRLLNGSNARVYRLAFNDGRTFRQVATDNALLEAPVELSTLTLSPGERAEIVVNCTADLGKSLVLLDTLSRVSLLMLNVDKTPAQITTLPATLANLEWLDPAAAARTRSFRLSMAMRMGMGMMMGTGGGMQFLINGVSMDLARIDQTVPLNDIEIWEIRNAGPMGMLHSFHVHGTHFTIVERNGSAANVHAYEKGYKDTVLLESGEVVKLILKMTDYTAAANAPYMFHCHILEHEDRGMMGQFIVT